MQEKRKPYIQKAACSHTIAVQPVYPLVAAWGTTGCSDRQIALREHLQ